MLSEKDKGNLKLGATLMCVVFIFIIVTAYCGKKAITIDSDRPHTPSEWNARR